MLVFYKRWKKYNETQLTENKMDLKKALIKQRNPKLSEMWGSFGYYLSNKRVLQWSLSMLAALVLPDLPHASKSEVRWEYTKELHSLTITSAGNWQYT